MMRKLRSLVRREEGVTAMEYGMIAALVAIAIVFAVGNVGTQLKATFQKIADTLSTANSGGTPSGNNGQ